MTVSQTQPELSPVTEGPCVPGAGIATPETIKDVQARLILLGYGAGPVDGVLGERTRNAIRAYQSDHGLLTDGLATPELATYLRETSTRREGQVQPPSSPEPDPD